jgi:transglycosylase-like protein with SLT domain
MTLPQRVVASFLLLATVAAAGAALYVIRALQQPILLPTVPSIRPAALLFDVTPVRVRTTVEWQKVFITVPRWDFLHDHTIWRRMQFEDWDVLPADVRKSGLQRLLNRYGSLAADRRAWRAMTANDWDDVPQPARVMAIAGMIEYWVGHYNVGTDAGLDRESAARTVKAIAMSESWFEHRAVYRNSDGSFDIGLGGASDFARRTIRRWYVAGLCDFTMSDDDYYNPWLASRWIAFWFEEMLQEAGGDVDLAVRAYNKGIGDALDGDGGDYLTAVRRRRRRYFVGPSNSPTWTTLSEYRRHSLAAVHAVRK